MKILLSTMLMMVLGNSGRAENSIEPKNNSFKKATFAGGCFWCMEPPYDKLDGVVKTSVGYTGGHKKNPTYREVCTGTTGHTEAVEILYDPGKISFEELLNVFWMNIDPTTQNQQFADVGSQYRTAVFYHDEEQKRLAQISKEKLDKSGKFKKPIVVEMTPAAVFYPAEEYHQKYYQKETSHYKAYRYGSGRESYLKETWGMGEK